MILLRCTGRVLKRFDLDPVTMTLEGRCLLSPWYANLLNVGPSRYVLCMSQRTLLPIIMPQRKGEFPMLFGRYLEPVLTAIGIPAEAAARESEAASSYAIAKTASKSMLGSMNDFTHMARRRFERTTDPLSVALELSGTPCAALEFVTPEKETCRAFGVPLLKRRMLLNLGMHPDPP